jgi:hypothetical protein
MMGDEEILERLTLLERRIAFLEEREKHYYTVLLAQAAALARIEGALKEGAKRGE